MVLHMAPEAADGGLLAIVKDGDLIKLDINNRRIDVLLPAEEITKRFASWVKPDLKEDPFVSGWMKQYALSVGSPSKGALVDLSFKAK
jgi:dihydroxy-acid dehydratase